MKWVEDGRVVEWLNAGLEPFTFTPRAIVPTGFAAYARIVHTSSPPLVGSLSLEEIRAAVEVLRRHTETSQDCWFCYWEGYGWTQGEPAVAELSSSGSANAPVAAIPTVRTTVRIGGRDYYLGHGALDDAEEIWRIGIEQTPNYWWPSTRSWLVASEIDHDSTYVGGPEWFIEDLVASDKLKALRVTV